MKQTLSNFSISLFISILLGIISSLVLAILKSNNAIDANMSNICINVLSIVVFFVFGFIFSIKQRKKGLLNGLILTCMYLLFYFIIIKFSETTTPTYLTISRIVAIMLGSLFGVNLVNKDDQTN